MNLSFYSLSAAIPRRSCKEIFDMDKYRVSGLYMINPSVGREFVVPCDMTLGRGGWTVIMRRTSGSCDFNVSMRDYVTGFGFYETNFWLGLEKIRLLTERNDMELWVGMEAYPTEGLHQKWGQVHYQRFLVGDAESQYTLTLDQFNSENSTLPDTLSESLNGVGFRSDCGAGWWQRSCEKYVSKLTGDYPNGDSFVTRNSFSWDNWNGAPVQLKTVVMAVRARP